MFAIVEEYYNEVTLKTTPSNKPYSLMSMVRNTFHYGDMSNDKAFRSSEIFGLTLCGSLERV
jgi:hypothetical protein